MSHFPIVQPLSVGQFGGGSYALKPEVGINTMQTFLSFTASDLDFTVATSYAIRAPDRIIPAFIQIVCQESSAMGAFTAPVISMGNNLAHNNWVTNYTLSLINTNTFGAGQWEMLSINYPITTDFSGIGTPYVRIMTPSNAAKDIRSVSVAGFCLPRLY